MQSNPVKEIGPLVRRTSSVARPGQAVEPGVGGFVDDETEHILEACRLLGRGRLGRMTGVVRHPGFAEGVGAEQTDGPHFLVVRDIGAVHGFEASFNEGKRVGGHRGDAIGIWTAFGLLAVSSGRPVLIDWEWAGLYPAGYELAFLWSSLVNIPAARGKVEAAVPACYRAGFVLSAALVQLLHLEMWQHRPHPLADRHRETLAQLLEEVGRAQ